MASIILILLNIIIKKNKKVELSCYSGYRFLLLSLFILTISMNTQVKLITDQIFQSNLFPE